MSFADINQFLHALRTREIRGMPPGAKVFLSAGCSGRWYFDWIRENYTGITRHLGIEAYSPKPDDLPDEAVWLADHIYNMVSVADEEADLVFAGQTVEHLWPNDMAGFLCESHRVLKPNGWLVLDSPTRPVAQALNWYQPQHTMEFSVAEIVELVTLAGFCDIRVKGVWLCYDRNSHSYLSFAPDLSQIDVNTDFRVIGARDRPEDSFIWWLEARKDGSRAPDRERIAGISQAVYDRAFAYALQREFTQVGAFQGCGANRIVKTINRYPGLLRFGPYVPVKPGNYIVRFQVGVLQPPEGFAQPASDLVALKLEVSAEQGKEILAEKYLHVKDLLCAAGRRSSSIEGTQQPLQGSHFVPYELAFSLQQVVFGVEFRAQVMGHLPVIMRAGIEFVDLDEVAQQLSSANLLSPVRPLSIETGQLRQLLDEQDAEIARLRTLVAGYENGRFIRTMRALHRWTHRQ